MAQGEDGRAGADPRVDRGPAPDPAGLVSTLSAVVDAVGSGTDAAASWDHAERTAMLRAIDRAAAVLTASRGRLLRAEAAAETWSAKGDPSLSRWDGRVSRTGRAGGTRREHEARTWGDLGRLADAAEAGRVTVEHVAAAGRALRSLSGPGRAAMTTPDVQQELLDAAASQDASTFGRTAARIAARLEPDSIEVGHEAQQAARFLTLFDRSDGTEVRGRLDRLSGHVLRLAVEALCPRPTADEERTHEQRQADALVTMAENVLRDPATTPGSAVPPQVSVLVTEETWARHRAHRGGAGGGSGGDTAGDRSARGGDAGSPPVSARPGRDERPYAGMLPTEPATLEDGTPVPHTQLARILCDCDLTRIVLDADGQVLDLGRTTRLYAGVHRKGVLARDRQCAWPGCGTHARWCEIHHILWWDRDEGVTSIENGVALCRYHHQVVHRHDLTITRHPVRTRRPDPGMPLVTYTFTDPRGRVVAPRCPPPGGERHGGLQATWADVTPRNRLPGAELDATPRRGPPGEGIDGRRGGSSGTGADLVPRTGPPGTRADATPRGGPPGTGTGGTPPGGPPVIRSSDVARSRLRVVGDVRGSPDEGGLW